MQNRRLREGQTVQEEPEESETESADAGQTETAEGGKALVAYFAYNENIGDTSGMSVDAIASASSDPVMKGTYGYGTGNPGTDRSRCISDSCQ